jgi:hypothetical protein
MQVLVLLQLNCWLQAMLIIIIMCARLVPAACPHQPQGAAPVCIFVRFSRFRALPACFGLVWPGPRACIGGLRMFALEWRLGHLCACLHMPSICYACTLYTPRIAIPLPLWQLGPSVVSPQLLQLNETAGPAPKVALGCIHATPSSLRGRTGARREVHRRGRVWGCLLQASGCT